MVVIEQRGVIEQRDGANVEGALLAVEHLAVRHAAQWRDLPMAATSGVRPVDSSLASVLGDVQARGTALFVERCEAVLSVDEVDTLRAVSAAVPRWLTARPYPRVPVPVRFSVVDRGAGEVAVVPQPGLLSAHPLREVAMLLGTGLDAGALRYHELELLVRYHDTLVAHGLDEYDLDQCLDDYRIGQLHVPFTAMITVALGGPRPARSHSEWLAAVRRSCTAISELRSLALVTGAR